jgi:protein involved in polysaccharide export with SLBB domain
MSGRPWIVGLTFLCLGVPAGAQQSTAATTPSDPPEASPGVRPGDVIRLWVWREKDYSGEFPVDARGSVVLPVLGEMTVSGHTAEQLADTLRGAYRKYLNNPSIEVTVLRRVAVQGEVVKPGLYPADATISIAELITLAGGVTPNGNQKKIELLRNGRVLVSGLGPGAVLQRSPVQSGDAIFVPQKGWFSRNGQIFLYGGVSLATAVLARLIVK